jgi:hypothetical protein
MKYIVTCVSVVMENDGSEDCEDSPRAEVHSLTPCENTKEIACAIQLIEDVSSKSVDQVDWAVFEQVNGKMERRAVVFKMAGRTRVDCTLS